ADSEEMRIVSDQWPEQTEDRVSQRLPEQMSELPEVTFKSGGVMVDFQGVVIRVRHKPRAGYGRHCCVDNDDRPISAQAAISRCSRRYALVIGHKSHPQSLWVQTQPCAPARRLAPRRRRIAAARFQN